MRFDHLLSRHLDGGLSPAEERELLELLEDPERERRFAELTRVDRELAGLLTEPVSDERMAELVLRDLRAPKKDSTRVIAVMAELPRRRRRRPFRDARAIPAWIPLTAAAALLVLVALASRPAGRRPAPAPKAPETVRVAEESPTPEILPAPPPVPPPAPPSPVPAPAPPPPPPSKPPEKAHEAPAPPLPPAPPSIPAVAEANGAPVRAGETLRGRVEVRYIDGTRLRLEPDAEIEFESPKRSRLVRGRLAADVARQPAGESFVILTPHAEAIVLGTSLALEVEVRGTRLDVTEGKVRLRRADGRSVDVAAGHFAVAAPGAALEARPLPIDEIVLRPSDARLVGGDWKLVDDPEAGKALESLREPPFRVRSDKDREAVNEWYAKGGSRSYALYSFQADAGRDYHVWVRARTLDTGPERFLHDDVMLQAPNARFTGRPADWYPYADTLSPMQGYGRQAGWWWSGGAHDPGKTQTPIALRFSRPGRQTLLLHASEPPIRVDTIWLTTTGATRPDAKETRR